MRDEVARDLEALLHAARKRLRRVVNAIFVDLDTAEPVERGIADIAVMPRAHSHEPLADVAAGRNAHAQTLARILVHEAPVGAHEEAPLGFVQVAARHAQHAIAHANSRHDPRARRLS